MDSTKSDLVDRAEAILASAKKFSADLSERQALMREVDLLYQSLEDPMEAMMRQWKFVRLSFQKFGESVEVVIS